MTETAERLDGCRSLREACVDATDRCQHIQALIPRQTGDTRVSGDASRCRAVERRSSGPLEVVPFVVTVPSVPAAHRGHHVRMGVSPQDRQITIVALVARGERCKTGQAISAFDARRPPIRWTEEGAR